MAERGKNTARGAAAKRRGFVRFIPWILCIAAFAMAFSIGAFFIYTLVLKTNYKNMAFEINESFRSESTVTMQRGDESFRIPTADAEYFNEFLLQRETAVFSKKAVPATEETIFLDFGGRQLSFTGLEDGSAIAVCWKTPEEEKHCIVRSKCTFLQLSAYYKNCRRKAEAG